MFVLWVELDLILGRLGLRVKCPTANTLYLPPPSQNVFLKIYFSKCISQNVFPKMYFPKCILIGKCILNRKKREERGKHSRRREKDEKTRER